MLGKLEDEVVVTGIVGSEFDRDLEHVLTEHRHPRSSVGLLEVAARRQFGAAIEDADVVEAEESAFEHALAKAILAIHPPREVDHELAEGALEELEVTFAAHRLLHAVLKDRRPRMHRRVDVAEVPLVGGYLTVGVLKARLQHQDELMLGKVRVDARERRRVKSEIPCRVPRVLPLVGHGDDVVVEHVEPLAVPDRDRRWRVERVHAVLAQPHVDVEKVVLLRPEEPAERLAHDVGGVCARRWGREGLIELVSLVPTVVHGFVEGRERARRLRRVGQAKPDLNRSAGSDLESIVGGRLGTLGRRVYCSAIPVHDKRVEGVFDVGTRVRLAEQPLGVGVVLGEQQWRLPVAVEPSFTQLGMRRCNHAHARDSRHRLQVWLSGLGHQAQVLRNHRVGSK